jgi:outer membrane protein TolC
VDAVVTQALEQSPSIRQRVATVAARRKSAAAAKGSWLPTVSTTFGWSRSTGEQGWGAIGELNPDRSRGYNLNFSFSFPVFDRFQRNVTISAANVAREDAEQDLRAARLDVEARVRSGLLDLQRAYQDFQLAQQLAQITQQQAELAEERFRLGALDFLNYQRIVDQNAQSQRDAVLARFVFNTARVTLEQTLGAPISR